MFRVVGVMFSVQGSLLRVQGCGFCVERSVFRVEGLGSRGTGVPDDAEGVNRARARHVDSLSGGWWHLS